MKKVSKTKEEIKALALESKKNVVKHCINLDKKIKDKRIEFLVEFLKEFEAERNT